MKVCLYLIIAFSISMISCNSDDDNGAIEASGNIEVVNVTISSKVNGEVLTLLKDEGDEVKTGDTLLIIDHENLELQLDQAEALGEQATAQYSLLKNGARQEDISSVEEQLNQAQSNYESAQRDNVRMQKLLESNTITKKQYEDSKTRFDVAAAQLNAAKENLKKIRNLARPEELKQAQANVKSRESGIALLKKNIRDSYVVSPINGIVVKKFIEKGEVASMMSSLYKISNLRKVDLVIYVSEEELGKVKLGQKAEVKVDSYENKTFNGKVTYISPEAEFTPKNIQTKDERTKLVFAVKIEIDNPKYELKAGMPADAILK